MSSERATPAVSEVEALDTTEGMTEQERLAADLPLETPADDEALFAHYLEELQRLSEHMKRDQAEIDRLKAETKALKAETQGLKEESRVLQTEIRASLARLQAA